MDCQWAGNGPSALEQVMPRSRFCSQHNNVLVMHTNRKCDPFGGVSHLLVDALESDAVDVSDDGADGGESDDGECTLEADHAEGQADKDAQDLTDPVDDIQEGLLLRPGGLGCQCPPHDGRDGLTGHFLFCLLP